MTNNQNQRENRLAEEKNVHLHLSMIQEIIKRMADNSFKIKGWCITLVSALLGLLIANKNVTTKDLLILFIPIVGFALIDSYYLRLERIFRNRYESDVDKLACGKIKEVDIFSFKSDKTKEEKTKYHNALFSASIFWVYVPLCAIIFFVMHVIKS